LKSLTIHNLQYDISLFNLLNQLNTFQMLDEERRIDISVTKAQEFINSTSSLIRILRLLLNPKTNEKKLTITSNQLEAIELYLYSECSIELLNCARLKEVYIVQSSNTKPEVTIGGCPEIIRTRFSNYEVLSLNVI